MLDPEALERIWRVARVWSRVRVPDRAHMLACWPAPQGRIQFDEPEPMHHIRAVFRLVYGDVPPDHVVQRVCATTGCVNPSHLAARPSRRWAATRKRRVA
jgi:hypothetical protein